MVDNKSDYNKKNFNLNNFIPSQNRAEFLDSLNVNLFNRYLTKDEFTHIVGIIGDADPNELINNQIKESTKFRQDNQLQPVITKKIGTDNHYMSFEDFLTKIGRTGVDTDKFNEWGATTQFNWIPPIDIDKIINYRDYYWDSNTGLNDPEYITIKNQKSWSDARFSQSLKTIKDLSNSISVVRINEITNVISVQGNVVDNYFNGLHLILSNSNGNNELLTVDNAQYNLSANTTDITVRETIDNTIVEETFISLVDIKPLSYTNGIAVISGDYTKLLIEGYPVAVDLDVTTIVKIKASTFNAVNNTTSIIFDTQFPYFSKLSLYPMLALLQAEKNVTNDINISLNVSVWNDNDIGKIVWYNNSLITSGNTGTNYFGLNTFVDDNAEFINDDVRIGDNLLITENQRNSGKYRIEGVISNTELSTSHEFFTSENLSYKIIRDYSIKSISYDQAPIATYINQLYLNTQTDILYQWDGSVWVKKYKGVSSLINIINDRVVTDYSNDNDWSVNNKWIHRSQITEYTGMIRAQMPIIEYFPYIEMSDTSYSSKIWKYRKNTLNSYSETDIAPRLIELLDFTYTGSEYTFTDPFTIVFDSKYGNFVNDIPHGYPIRFKKFGDNDGVYYVDTVSYEQLNPTKEYVSIIKLTTPLISYTEMPVGGILQPEKTSVGDTYISIEDDHWQYCGVKEITASSLSPKKNPMLDINVDRYIANGFETIVGLTSQTYALSNSTSIVEPTLLFDPSLQNIVLIDDYQEGDIRVYINGKRRYGIFEDLQSNINPDYVSGIVFVNGFTMKPDDIIRIELGEYAESEIGLKAVTVPTPNGMQLVNLVNIRKVEQNKTEINQYPFFALRDIYGDRLSIATSIFKYKEDSSYPVNPLLLKRIVGSDNDYSFIQELSNPIDGSLYCYYDYQNTGDELQTIWKRGSNNEMYAPIKVDGQWEMPNQWYYNIDHKNYSEVNLTQIYRHFKSIIDLQTQPGLFNRNGGLFFLDDNINYGLGGTIKEHNESFDTLVSAIFVNNGNPPRIIEFAKNQYNSQIRYITDQYFSEVGSLFYNTTARTLNEFNNDVINDIINFIENNEKYDQWFGDTTSYNNGKGIRNWIASAVQLGLMKPVKPILLTDDKMGIYDVIGHDGRTINVSFTPAMREQLLRRAVENAPTIHQIVDSTQDAFPTNYEGKELYLGILLLRTDKEAKTRKLYRVNGDIQWEEINPNTLFANAVLEIENRLYDISISYDIKLKYNFDKIKEDDRFESLMEEQFNQYALSQMIDNPLINSDRFRQNNPFTWNYSFTPIKNDPITGTVNINVAGCWQALYENVLGTSYPHLEPWKLQGYDNAPTWWNSEYKSISSNRRWKVEMWDNIFNGVVPAGYELPNGDISTGSLNSVTKYIYLPINTSESVTDDGIGLDEILPPYWNSINTDSPKVRGLYDPNDAEFVVTPQLDFTFGENGIMEWEWRQSGDYIYDLMIVAYKIDPMRFIHSTFGVDFELVSCLQISKESEKVFSHNDVVFHGDFIDSENRIYKSFGLNQWYIHYNRYAGYDGISSEFRSLWKEWTPDLSYLFGAFIDTSSFRINSDFFDITNKDYDISIKKTKGISDKWLQSLSATVTSIPNQYSKLRDKGIGWSAVFNNISPVNKPFEYYDVQNYSVNINTGNNTIKLYSYPISGIEYQPSRGLQTVLFSSPLALSNSTGLDINQTYPLSIIFDGSITVGVEINGVNTIDELIFEISSAIKQYGSAELDNGNIVIYSFNNTTQSSVSIEAGSVFEYMTDFDRYDDPSVENNIFNKCFIIDGNFTSIFQQEKKIIISDNTIFNGTYNIDRVFYNTDTLKTLIYIKENISLPSVGSFDISANIEPFNAKTMPDSWVDGTVIYFNTTGYLPSNLDDEVPYYIIRIDDRTFQIADNELAAKTRIPMNISGKALGEVYAGHLAMTFNALGKANTDYTWRTHAIDTRYVNKGNNISISGIQLMIDFITGYAAYTEAQGFRFKNPNGDNYDRVTGMNNNWHSEIEIFVDWLFALRNYNQESSLSYRVRENTFNDTIVMQDGRIPNWQTGTAVVIIKDGDKPLPDTFNTPFSSSIPYYVIRLADDDTSFKLALSKYDASKGNYINLVDSGANVFRVQMYKEITKFPYYELNPFKHYVWVNHEQGIMGNVLDEDYTDTTSAARLYDNNLIEMPVSDVLVFREDRESRISLTKQLIENNISLSERNIPTRYMAGMHLFFDGYEHILRFNDYSVSNSLIYDSFFGLATPRFYLEFDRQTNFTLRPNVGGFVIQGDSLVQNLESVTNDMRYFYDVTNASEGRLATELARKSMGYDGPKDYMSDIKINDKTQFQFWMGMIQNKGTNKAVDAFVNQIKFESAIVDEFWAYKLGSFGDSAEKNHIEMKLIPDDTVRNELRLEFVAPENVAPDRSFKSIQLTDMSRWWNQPDQLEAMLPNKAFYFNAKVIKIVEDFNEFGIIQEIDDKLIYVSDTLMPNVVISYLDERTKLTTTMVKGIDYKILNSNIIQFIKDPRNLPEATLSVMTYDYDSHNPAVIIDKEKGLVTTKLPIWNPAQQQYYAPAYSIVDIRNDIDPAVYNNSIDGSNTGTALWKGDHVGQVWFDSRLEDYIPYYDSTVMPNINDRIAKWGELAPWGKISLYQWTESTLTPEEYDKKSVADSKKNTMSNDEKVTGSVYKKLYMNVNFEDPNDADAEPYWVELTPFNVQFIAGLTEGNVDTTLAGKTVDLYINGVFKENITFENAAAVNAYFRQMYFGNYCHARIDLPVPTEDEIRANKYKYFTPYTVEKRFDIDSGDVYNVYYYWVTEKKNNIEVANIKTTLYGAQKELNHMTSPFMIIDGFRTPDFGYGLIFGNIYDEYGYDLPFRYTQCIIKGLQGKAKEENRFVIRYTRDFTLRDKLDETSITPKNKHVEWKLFREKQFEKIDKYLWNKLIEALIGYRLTNDGNQIDKTKTIPTLNRVLYDRLYHSDTQYGLGDEQVFTNKELSLNTIMSLLTDPNITYEFVLINEFLENNKFITPEDIFSSMNYIYDNFSSEEVNRIFFATLYDALSVKLEYKEILKTSWVALQISENVRESVNVPYDELRLVDGPGCEIPAPSPTPMPSPTPTPTPTATPEASVTPTPTQTPTPSVSASMMPTPTPSLSSTPIPSPTPTPAPQTDVDWNVLMFGNFN